MHNKCEMLYIKIWLIYYQPFRTKASAKWMQWKIKIMFFNFLQKLHRQISALEFHFTKKLICFLQQEFSKSMQQ